MRSMLVSDSTSAIVPLKSNRNGFVVIERAQHPRSLTMTFSHSINIVERPVKIVPRVSSFPRIESNRALTLTGNNTFAASSRSWWLGGGAAPERAVHESEQPARIAKWLVPTRPAAPAHDFCPGPSD